METVAALASPTAQWPEAIHPRTGGGCMGDDQHVWAAAAWVLMVRKALVREEGDRLILAGGMPRRWLQGEGRVSFGPAPTRFGTISLELTLLGANRVRIPAIQNFDGSDFSVVLPVPGRLREALDRFRPEIAHAHHPYLLGMTALRIARYRNLPLVFTHHTRYEEYTHYVPLDSPLLKRFVIELATRYANLCDQVFAPSQSIAELIRGRGVTTPVAVVPTGVEIERFAQGTARACVRPWAFPRMPLWWAMWAAWRPRRTCTF
jgi:glycosyltransferase involved in cell wall biosynthesis